MITDHKYQHCILAYTDINSHQQCLQRQIMAISPPISRPLPQKLLHADSRHNKASMLYPSLQIGDVEPFDTILTNIAFCSPNEGAGGASFSMMFELSFLPTTTIIIWLNIDSLWHEDSNKLCFPTRWRDILFSQRLQ